MYKKVLKDRRGKNQKGAKNPNWKGDNLGYYAVHRWIEKIFGKPKYCEKCKSSKKTTYDWANISGKYLRKKEDWTRLCRSCHMKEDGRMLKLLSFNINRIPWNKGKKKLD